MKRIFLILFISISLFSQVNTFRLWSYFNLNIPFQKNFTFTILPGIRYEFSRENAEPNGFYMFEFFTGFSYSKNFNGILSKFPVYYYIIGFLGNEDYYVQSLEILPSFAKRFGNFVIYERTIFHNRFYSSYYDDRTGYSLLIRELLQLKYLIGKYGIILGIEPFYGVIEDDSHTPSTLGFTPKGLNLNRVNIGLDYQLTKNFLFSTNYVYETTYSNNSLTGKNHYLFLNIILNLFY